MSVHTDKYDFIYSSADAYQEEVDFVKSEDAFIYLLLFPNTSYYSQLALTSYPSPLPLTLPFYLLLYG